MEERARHKAAELITAFGYKHALMVCVEMNIEFIAYPNADRAEFWKLTKKEVEKQSI